MDNGVESFIAAAERSRGDGDDAVSENELRLVLTAAVRLYARRAEAVGVYPAPIGGAVTATEALTIVSEMIRAVDVNIFDLSMWHGRRK